MSPNEIRSCIFCRYIRFTETGRIRCAHLDRITHDPMINFFEHVCTFFRYDKEKAVKYGEPKPKKYTLIKITEKSKNKIGRRKVLFK